MKDRNRILTIGTFDMLHASHVKLFDRCKRIGDLSIGVNSDEFVRTYKGIIPYDNQRVRREKVSQHSSRTYLHHGETPEFIDDWLRRDVFSTGRSFLAIGTDWARKDYMAQLDISVDWLDMRELSLLYVSFIKPESSTDRRRAVNYCGQCGGYNGIHQPDCPTCD